MSLKMFKLDSFGAQPVTETRCLALLYSSHFQLSSLLYGRLRYSSISRIGEKSNEEEADENVA